MTCSLLDKFQILSDPNQPVALAVSGGSDSMAMLHLFAAWRLQHPLEEGCTDLVLSVDHGVRPEAAEEVTFVLAAAKGLGFDARGLKLDGLRGVTSLQEKARVARYEAMAEVMTECEINSLLTAHTLDDQAETFLMRVKRGSGVEGLSAIHPTSEIFGVRVVRPLLDLSKKDLKAFLQGQQLSWREDPSNEQLIYERVEVREALKEFDHTGDYRVGIAQSARRLGYVRDALKLLSDQFCLTNLKRRPEGWFVLSSTAYQQLPFALQVKVLQTVLDLFGRVSSLASVEKAVKHLLYLERGRFALGGVMFERERPGDFSVYREVARERLETLDFCLDDLPISWDRRLSLSFEGVKEEVEDRLIVRGLDLSEVDCIQGFLGALHNPIQLGFSKDVLQGVLTIWDAGSQAKLVAVPQLSNEMAGYVFEALGQDVKGVKGDRDQGKPFSTGFLVHPLKNIDS